MTAGISAATIAAAASVASAGAGIGGAIAAGSGSSGAAKQGALAQWQAQQRAIQFGQDAYRQAQGLYGPIIDRGNTEGYWGLKNAITQSDNNTKLLGSLLSPYLNAGTAAIGGVTGSLDASQKIFDQLRSGLNPYMAAGVAGIKGQQRVIDSGPVAFKRMTPDQIMAGPEYQAMVREGENAILSNASATGGLRGGNTQNALANFRQNTLAQLIGQEFDRGMSEAQFAEGNRVNQAGLYGGLAGTGLNASQLAGNLNDANVRARLSGYGGLINAGQNSAALFNDAMQNQIRTRLGVFGDMYGAGLNATGDLARSGFDLAQLAGNAAGNQGAAQAAGMWGQAQANGQMWNGIANGFGRLAGAVPWGRLFPAGSSGYAFGGSGPTQADVF